MLTRQELQPRAHQKDKAGQQEKEKHYSWKPKRNGRFCTENVSTIAVANIIHLFSCLDKDYVYYELHETYHC